MEPYYEGLRAPEEERIEIGKELFRRHVDEVWTIGCLDHGMAV